jgi:hypothetical protein
VITVNKEIIEEIALCIVVNQLDEDEACNYAWTCVMEHNAGNCEEVGVYVDEERIINLEKAYNLLRDTVNEQVPSLPNGKPKFIIRDICEVTI